MVLSEDFISELKSRNDISEVIGEYVNLQQKGRNLMGLCPFHSERTPSFCVYPSNGSFYCFGCGAGGDVITFLRLIIAPMIIIPIMSFIPCDKMVFMTVMLAVSCPSAAIGTLFAVKYNKNAVYCSELFALTTVISAVTMPLMILYMGLFC